MLGSQHATIWMEDMSIRNWILREKRCRGIRRVALCAMSFQEAWKMVVVGIRRGREGSEGLQSPPILNWTLCRVI